jgi:hypothetical protein
VERVVLGAKGLAVAALQETRRAVKKSFMIDLFISIDEIDELLRRCRRR